MERGTHGSIRSLGYTPKLSTAVALFREDPKTHRLLSLTGMGEHKHEESKLPRRNVHRGPDRARHD